MSWSRRFLTLFQQQRLYEEVDEELASHLEEAVERGRTPEEARRAFGSAGRHRDEIRDVRLLPRWDDLAADVRFGWRHLKANPAVSAAAVLSLALGMGATTAAFRLVDAVLLRPLPIHEPGGVYFLGSTFIDRDGKPDYRDDFDYPTFRRYREALKGRADLMVVGMVPRQEGRFGTAGEDENFYRQYVSGNVFGAFGLQPAAGRLLSPDDDVRPGGSAVAVLSYDYWIRRFAGDARAVGSTFRYANREYEIVGVGPKGFTGTEPGKVTDIFLPAMMNADAIESPGWSWFRIWLRAKPGFGPEQARLVLQALVRNEHRERAARFPGDMPKAERDAFMKEDVLMFPAGAGASELQREYRRPLAILAFLVVLVLMVACANVGNLLAAQAAGRAREMALRVSIGAGKARLMQLVLVESALLAVLAAALGTLFSWWAAPLVVNMLGTGENAVRLVLSADSRSVVFGIALTLLVTLGFGLGPALRASSVTPVSALKGGGDTRGRGGFMNLLVAGQMALCVLVLFVAGLFVATFQRLSTRSLGFASEGVVAMEISAGKKQTPEAWVELARRLRQGSGAEAASVAGWALLSGNHWTATVRVPGRTAELRPPYFLDVSPGFFDTMRMELIAGRDFRTGDRPPEESAGVGIVNEAFVRRYLEGAYPVGRSVDVRQEKGRMGAMEIVGYVRDAAYSNVRERVRPTVYLPLDVRKGGTVLVRSSRGERAVSPALRQLVNKMGAEFRVTNVDTQSAMVQRQMIRERLLAALSLFFAGTALVLAGIGLYGVLNYSVVRRRKEIGIRMALGAPWAKVVRHVTGKALGMVAIGAGAGVAAGMASAQLIEKLLYEVKATDAGMIAGPLLVLLAAAALAALPPAVRAVRIDPAQTLREE